ncbi:histone H3-like centromeric protein cpar-1 [Symbiodinium microadriaticum]|uniref:Histone H3-like centromeric protein cpar-1 n=1 Tax=Symbiodinium microadriaticum TaxID=2951 RepID=A0A1Q9CKI1_SYMMI|nr:histone H3-like centromeric protein cpar-1 [Symbiodinium microadriaticum]
MAAPAVEVEEKDQGDYRDLLNLLPAWWLPLSVRNLVMIRVILTGFLGEPWVTKAVDEVPCREKYTGNHGKGGRPKKHQQVQVRSSGRFGGQARSAEAEIRWCQRHWDQPLFQRAKFVRIVKDILSDLGKKDFRFSTDALDTLMQATTAFGVEGFVRGAMCARHARRGTVMPHDYRLHGMLQNVRAGDVVAVPPPPPKQVKVKPAGTPKVEKAKADFLEFFWSSSWPLLEILEEEQGMKAEPPASELSLEACKDIESALLRPYVQKNVRYGQRSHWGCLLHYLVWLAKDNFGDGWPNKVIIASSSTLDLVDVMKLQAKAQGIGVVLSTDTHWSLLCIGVGTAAAYLYDGLGCKKTWELAEAVMSHVNERQQCAATALRGDFPRQEDEWSCGHRLIIAFQYFLSSFNEGSWPPAMPAGEFSLVMIQLHTDTQTHRHTDTQTHRHTDTQTHRHTDTQTHRHTDTQTHRHTDTQTHRHTDTQTHRHTDTQTHRHTDTQTHRHTVFMPWRQRVVQLQSVQSVDQEKECFNVGGRSPVAPAPKPAQDTAQSCRRVALVLRGHSFLWRRGTTVSRGGHRNLPQSVLQQLAAVTSHLEHVVRPMEALGFEVDIYGATYPSPYIPELEASGVASALAAVPSSLCVRWILILRFDLVLKRSLVPSLQQAWRRGQEFLGPFWCEFGADNFLDVGGPLCVSDVLQVFPGSWRDTFAEILREHPDRTHMHGWLPEMIAKGVNPSSVGVLVPRRSISDPAAQWMKGYGVRTQEFAKV